MERRVIVGLNNQPLVSVPVITYNSSKFVLETLESIKAQTYQNIELIISDDCSADNTVELCQQWVEKNKTRFVRTQIITSETNTGVSANLNRAEAACQGEWVKGIAGDDLLMPNCIADCVEYALEKNANCIFGKIEAFGENQEYAQYLTDTFSERNDYMSTLTNDALYDMIIKGDTPPAPAFFYRRQFFIDNDITNDVRIPMIEDLPKWLNLLNSGCKFQFLNKTIAKYRLGGISTRNQWQSPKAYDSQRKMFYYYQFEYLYKLNHEHTINAILDHESLIYQNLYNENQNLRNSKAYKLGKMILKTIKRIQRIWKKIMH